MAVVTGDSAQMQPQEAAQSFEMACRQTAKAWAGTSLLARTRASRVDALERALQAGPKTLAAFFAELAAGSMAGHAMATGMDDSRALELGKLVIQAASDALRQGDSMERLAELKAVLLHWLEHGRHPGAPDLARIDVLIGANPAVRLGLLAAFAPCVESSIYVLRARAEGYPFAEV